jgi:hypothetical protein
MNAVLKHDLCQKKLTLVLTKMKSRNLFFASLAFVAGLCHASEMSSFDQERQKYLSYKDPTRISYLYNRCAALQLNVAALMARKGQAQGAKDYEALAQHYMVLSEANERAIDKKRGIKSKDTMKTVQRNVANISELYSARMRNNLVQRGEYFLGDPQVEYELHECLNPNEFVAKLNK